MMVLCRGEREEGHEGVQEGRKREKINWVTHRTWRFGKRMERSEMCVK
jgi:hypothetical protein